MRGMVFRDDSWRSLAPSPSATLCSSTTPDVVHIGFAKSATRNEREEKETNGVIIFLIYKDNLYPSYIDFHMEFDSHEAWPSGVSGLAS